MILNIGLSTPFPVVLDGFRAIPDEVLLLIFSQDQDLSEVADELRAISVEQNRWIKLACAFPTSPTYANTRGIDKSAWVRIDRTMYDSCLDPRDYRPKGRVP